MRKVLAILRYSTKNDSRGIGLLACLRSTGLPTCASPLGRTNLPASPESQLVQSGIVGGCADLCHVDRLKAGALAADELDMAVGLLFFACALAAALCYRWQQGLPKQVNALLSQTEQAHKQGDLAAAESSCLRAVACARRIWFHGGAALATSLYNLAILQFEQDRPPKPNSRRRRP